MLGATPRNSILRFVLPLFILFFYPIHGALARTAKIGVSLAIFANVREDNRPSGSELEYLPVRQDEIRECMKFLRFHSINHIRLIVNPIPLMSADRTVSREALRSILAFVKMANRSQVGVTLDLHTWSPRDPATQTYEIMASQALRHRYAQVVMIMSASLSKIDFGKNSLELMNEPSCRSPEWPEFQNYLYKTARKKSNKLRLVITGCGGSIDNLLKLDISNYVGDRYVSYSFHFYEPFIFTHQQNYYGARFRSIPFPPDLLTDQNRLDIQSSQKHIHDNGLISYRGDLRHYLNMGQAVQDITERFKIVAKWSEIHNLKRDQIYVGEFGLNIPVLDDDLRRVHPDIIRWMTITARAIASEGFSAATWPPISQTSELHRSRFDLIHGDKTVISALGWR